MKAPTRTFRLHTVGCTEVVVDDLRKTQQPEVDFCDQVSPRPAAYAGDIKHFDWLYR